MTECVGHQTVSDVMIAHLGIEHDDSNFVRCLELLQ
jgi:hypothetical protein